ncbi:oligosaccharide flippase family protein [Candidatus Dojkabacteria bacterium]|nr:oligosaccharide flippase family protein [Candidatus Dojkabacteria bacterium]
MDDSNTRDLELRSIAWGASIEFLFLGLSYAIMFLFRLVGARIYGSELYGAFSLVETLFGIGILLGSAGITNGIVAIAPRYLIGSAKRNFNQYFTFVLLFCAISSLLITGTALLFSGEIVSLFNTIPTFETLFLLVTVAIPFRILGDAFGGFLIATRNIYWNAISLHLLEKGSLLLGALACYAFSLPLFYLVLFFVFSVTIRFVSASLFFVRKEAPKWISDLERSKIKGWLEFSLPLFLTGILAYAIAWIDNLFLGIMRNPSELGVYAIAYSVALFLLMFQTSLGTIFTPVVSSNIEAKKFAVAKRLFSRVSLWAIMVTIPVLAIIGVYSKQVLLLLFGGAYTGGSVALSVLCIFLLPVIIFGFSNNLLLVLGKTRSIFLINSGTAILNIILNGLLIPIYGIMGAAMATGLSFSFRSVFQFAAVKKSFDLVISWMGVTKVFAASFPSIIVMVFVYRFFHNVILSLIFSSVVFALTYIAVLVILRFFNAEDFEVIVAIEEKFGRKFTLLRKLIEWLY